MSGLSLREIIEGRGFEASIATTYSVYLPFYENCVLPRLLNQRTRLNLLLVDAGQFSEAMAVPSLRPACAGRDYALIPVSAAAAFHPKVILLLGRDAARVSVGSHNMTLSGFGSNREATVRVDVPKPRQDDEGRTIIASTWRFLEAWIEANRLSVPAGLRESLVRARDRAPWLSETLAQTEGPAPSSGFLGSLPTGPALLDRLSLPRSKRIVVTAPFLDNDLEFLGRLTEIGGNVVAAIDRRADLPRAAVRSRLARFVDMGEGGLLHAKILYADGAKASDAVLVVGSANPSEPAWLASPADRNCEAVFVLRGARAREAAQKLGMDGLVDAKPISADELQRIADEAAERRHQTFRLTSVRAIVAAAAAGDGVMRIDATVLASGLARAVLVGREDQHLGDAKITEESGTYVLTFVPETFRAARVVRLELADGGTCLVLPHVQDLFLGATRSHDRQRLHEALSDLGRSAVNTDELFRLMERWIFEAGTGSSARGAGGGRRPQPERPDSAPIFSLAAGPEEDAQRRGRRRLTAGSEFDELLAELIYLVGQYGMPAPDTDAEPSEEEMVGLDDGESTDENQPIDDVSARGPDELERRKSCARRVNILIGRLVGCLKKATAADADVPDALYRLLAGLAFLRELRTLDRAPRRAAFLPDGETEYLEWAPTRQLERLWREGLGFVLGSEHALWERACRSIEFQESEEAQRLAGLLVWLGWQIGIDVDARAPFNEDPEDRAIRLERRAALFAVLATAAGDVSAFAEAERSMERTSPATDAALLPNWLPRHRIISTCLGEAQRAHEPLPEKRGALQNHDLATFASFPYLIRVERQAGDTVHLRDLVGSGVVRKFIRSKVSAVDLVALSSRARF